MHLDITMAFPDLFGSAFFWLTFQLFRVLTTLFVLLFAHLRPPSLFEQAKDDIKNNGQYRRNDKASYQREVKLNVSPLNKYISRQPS